MKGNTMKDKIICDLKSRSMSIKTLAADMGCSYEHLTRILNGKLPMSYKVAIRLCKSLNKLTSNTYDLTDFGF